VPGIREDPGHCCVWSLTATTSTNPVTPEPPGLIQRLLGSNSATEMFNDALSFFFEAADDLALALERLRVLDAKFEGEGGNHVVVSGR